ncbi:Protein mms22 [Lachnellula suecica]|uniref:Protein mms22 n=1 Tax=Lachnellula suecica TaxID=602035 RepID=A0A8T9C128_9HELO|nr:Protein mms22 [Lachnellula suecica]
MANWKERGEVPDSDDDSELDSQIYSTPNEPTTEVPGASYSLDDAVENGGDEAGEDAMYSNANPGLYIAANVGQGNHEGAVLNGEEKPPHPEGHGVSPRLSPYSPQAFKVPRAFPELDGDAEGILFDHESERNNDFPGSELAVDEISHSYVRITSATSSPLSTLPSSQESLSKEANGFSPYGKPPAIEAPDQPIHREPTMQPPSSLLPPLIPPNNYQRTFRQRNPIQVHPYLLEQEKYRRTFTSRGMTPMRLAQIQDERNNVAQGSQATSSTDPDSQELDFGIDETEQMDVDWDPPSSPPVPPSGPPQKEPELPNDVPNDLPAVDSDDEFPDIDELLRAPIPPRQVEPKRRVKTYTSKLNRPSLSRIETQHSRKTPSSTDIFDIPASPPATSSPFAATSRVVRKSQSRTLSLSSKEATPVWLGQREQNFQAAADLPTPMTSATKPITNSMVIESDSDLDDPFATDIDLSPAASSSDESVQIRKVGKKIRGVLPASHLRLDQPRKKTAAPSRTQRESLSLSPVKLPARRGVALARPSGTAGSPPATRQPVIHFISDDSDDDENNNGFIMEDDENNQLEQLFRREGSAEEDDRVDFMLPGQKRRPRTFGKHDSKRQRVGSRAVPRKSGNEVSPQPKITEHLQQPRRSAKPNSKSRKRRSSFGNTNRTTVGRRRKPPPRLSILDVTDINIHSRQDVPQFVRIAARTARSKAGQGRQSPSMKFIRLASREDTVDAQSVLEDWRGGKIPPKVLENLREPSDSEMRRPLHPLANNRQNNRQSCAGNTKYSSSTRTGDIQTSRKLVVSKQRSMSDYVTSKEPVSRQYDAPPAAKRRVWNHPQGLPNKPRRTASSARPAQLEASEVQYSRQNPASAFKSTKKTLDAIYRKTRRRRGPQDNLQLGRFLADDDVVDTSRAAPTNANETSPNDQPLQIVVRRRKPQPSRMDIGAARYRQPSEPLILDFLSPTPAEDTPSEGNKIMGLGKFGTKYSLHFDIFPLQSGIYFHDSTFIGGGGLSKAMKSPVIQTGLVRQHTSLRLGSKDFRWGPWNQTVSSEIGLCFDWILDQLFSSPPASAPPTVDTTVVVTFVINYIQDHLSLAVSSDQTDFLTRIIEVLQDFSARVYKQLPSIQRGTSRWIEVLNRCMLIGLRVLQIARANPKNASLGVEVENVLKSIARACITLLLSHGVDGIRKLYDDLQYLSFRERGIRSDQYAIQSWVISMKVLDEARIPRGSFWDIVNSELVSTEVKNTNDARIMEKLWYSMFSLLPLCEFDEFGVVKPGRRRNLSFDNWSLPQQLLKRVFALYTSNSRQPPGFNDYCRTIVSRCQYLMTVWGWWKCSTIIGTVFDFFASQRLSHLRNEEVYDSPQFLRELDREPSMEVDPEDRCFHILLKMVGLAVKHMDKVGDVKGIRNLVARLLPNHDRQYPKEEAIHQRDLACLRNHHDLLCTLYWAAPPDQRPSPVLIQELVTADRSHKEACLINIRAWENLTRFVVTNSSNVNTYQPFTLWQNEFSIKLSQQYLGTESEVRHQAEALEKSDKSPISEGLLKQTILANRKSTMETLRVMVRVMDHTVKAATSAQLAIQAFNPELLRRAIRPDSWNGDDLSDGILQHCVECICHYMEQIDRLEPVSVQQFDSNSATDFDSQGSLDMDLNLDRVEMIYRLQTDILPLIRTAIRRGLEFESNDPLDPSILPSLVSCWSSLVLKLTESAMNLGEFLVKSPNAVFQRRAGSNRANAYWPLFLSKLLDEKTLDDFQIPNFDIGLEWLLALSKPQSEAPSILDMVNGLTTRLQAKNYYLSAPPPRTTSSAINSGMLGENTLPNHRLIKTAVEAMRATLTSQANVDLVFANKSLREAHAMFSSMLKEVMESIKQHLESMTPGSAEHKEYVGFVQLVISVIRSYASDIRPPLTFFSQPSTHYWPEDADPNLFAAGIISYSLRLVEHPRKTAPILFHYLYTGWRKDMIHGRVGKHMSYVKKGMKRPEFVTFLMTEFMPAALHVGFHSIGGWVLCATYLPILSSRVINMLHNKDSEAASAFGYLVNILRIIVNGISTRYVGTGFNGVDLTYQAMVSVACQFWLSVALPTRQYTDADSEARVLLSEVTAPLTRFILQACQPQEAGFGTGLWEIEQLQVKNGDHIENFVDIMTKDIRDRWSVDRGNMGADIGGTGAQEGSKTWVDFSQVVGVPPPLLQMLELALPILELTPEDRVPPAVLLGSDRLLRDVYF